MTDQEKLEKYKRAAESNGDNELLSIIQQAERANQLDKEILFIQESLRNSIKICATQFENMQRYVKALKFYADEDIYTVQDGERIKGIFTDQGEKARQALKGDPDA